MAIIFDNFNKAKALAKIVDAGEAAKLNRLFYDGEHWNGAEGWIGPIPATTDETYEDLKKEIERAFNSRNVIKEVVDRKVDGLLGRDPRRATIRSEPITDEKPLAPNDETRIDEANALAARFWNKRQGLKLLKQAMGRGLLDERPCVRLYVPRGLLVDSGDGVLRVPRGSVEDCLDKIRVQVTSPGQAAVFTDEETEQEAAIYREARADGEYVEMIYIDGGDTIIRILQDEQATETNNPGQRPPDAYALQIGGRLTIFEPGVRTIVSEQVRANQKAINLAMTMQNRNLVAAGFLERVILDAMPPGEWEDDPEHPGDAKYRRYKVAPFQVGAGTTNFYNAAETVDDSGNVTGRGNPSVSFRGPESPQTFIDSKRDCYQNVLEEVGQPHVLISGDATASGISRVQARQIFESGLRDDKGELDALVEWMVWTPLLMAAFFAGQPNYFDGLMLEAECYVDAGPRSPEEMKQDQDKVNAGLLSKETAMSRDGVSEPAAELARIQGEESTSLSMKQQKAAIFEILARGGAGAEGAAQVAEFGDDDIAALARGDFPVAPQVGGDVIEGSVDPMDLQAGITAEKTLNGAQIRAALDVIDRLGGGDESIRIAPPVAVELLAAVGIPREVAQRMVDNSKK